MWAVSATVLTRVQVTMTQYGVVFLPTMSGEPVNQTYQVRYSVCIRAINYAKLKLHLAYVIEK